MNWIFLCEKRNGSERMNEILTQCHTVVGANPDKKKKKNPIRRVCTWWLWQTALSSHWPGIKLTQETGEDTSEGGREEVRVREWVSVSKQACIWTSACCWPPQSFSLFPAVSAMNTHLSWEFLSVQEHRMASSGSALRPLDRSGSFFKVGTHRRASSDPTSWMKEADRITSSDKTKLFLRSGVVVFFLLRIENWTQSSDSDLKTWILQFLPLWERPQFVLRSHLVASVLLLPFQTIKRQRWLSK